MNTAHGVQWTDNTDSGGDNLCCTAPCKFVLICLGSLTSLISILTNVTNYNLSSIQAGNEDAHANKCLMAPVMAPVSHIGNMLGK